MRRLQDAYHFRYFYPSHIQWMYIHLHSVYDISCFNVLYTVPLLETAVSMCRPRCDVWIIFVLLSGHNKYSAAVRDLLEKHKRCTKLHIETYEDIQKTSKTFQNDLAKLEVYWCWSESCNLLSIIQFLWEKNVLTVHVESSKQLRSYHNGLIHTGWTVAAPCCTLPWQMISAPNHWGTPAPPGAPCIETCRNHSKP